MRNKFKYGKILCEINDCYLAIVYKHSNKDLEDMAEYRLSQTKEILENILLGTKFFKEI